MANNREILAENISKRFVDAISGTDREQILVYNPEDRIYVGKLSPQSKEEDSKVYADLFYQHARRKILFFALRR